MTLMKQVWVNIQCKLTSLDYSVPFGVSGAGVFNEHSELIGIISRSGVNLPITYAAPITAFDKVQDAFIYKKPLSTDSDNYDVSYCTEKKTLETWKKISQSTDLRMLQELHAIFLGLCAKVGRHDITTDEANYLFYGIRNVYSGLNRVSGVSPWWAFQ